MRSDDPERRGDEEDEHRLDGGQGCCCHTPSSRDRLGQDAGSHGQ